MSSHPLAGPMGEQCCTPAPTTVTHVGTPRGRTETYAGVRTYVVRPADFGQTPAPGAEAEAAAGKGVVLYFSDIFGPFYVNAQLTMDYWAAHGYTVLGVDYLEGESILNHIGKPGFDWRTWVVPLRERAPVVTKPWLEEVRKVHNGSKFFCIGNCFGAPYVMDLLADGWVTAGAFAHPTFLDEDHFKKVKGPLLMLCAEDDHSFGPDARRRAVDILVEAKAEYTMVLFGGISHGFATRADPSVPKQRWGKEHAAATALSWFDHHGQYSV